MSIVIVKTERPGTFVRIKHQQDGRDATETPSSTWSPSGHLCWHCCQALDTSSALPMPLRHDDRRDIFQCAGEFCSLECIYGYNRDVGKAAKGFSGGQGLALFQFSKQLTGNSKPAVHPAPPRCLLRAFGGPLTVDAFRQASQGIDRRRYETLVSKCILVEQVYHERAKDATKGPKTMFHPVHVPTSSSTPSGGGGNMLKMKASHQVAVQAPKKRKTILEETLGV